MKRVFVFTPGARIGKTFMIEDENVKSLEDLKEILSEFVGSQVQEVHFGLREQAYSPGGFADITNVDYIRNGDQLMLTLADELGNESDGFVKLNVGGKLFTTSRTTLSSLSPESMLGCMFSGSMSPGAIDSTSGAVMIDRSPLYFEPILNFLRTGKLVLDDGINPEGVMEEARYYGIDLLIPMLTEVIETRKTEVQGIPLVRRDVIKALITTPVHTELRFQGVNMAGADLSKLDLRNVNFKYANMRGCNLSNATLNFANMERADLSGAKFDGAQLLGVRMLCANMEQASLRACNFDDPAGALTIMEGANLKSAVMEGSNMARVNLRVATIKNGNLKNCDLRGAVLAGANLELCDLSGSDLGEANLRGANLKDTSLELMQTPIHMSQTIR